MFDKSDISHVILMNILMNYVQYVNDPSNDSQSAKIAIAKIHSCTYVIENDAGVTLLKQIQEVQMYSNYSVTSERDP